MLSEDEERRVLACITAIRLVKVEGKSEHSLSDTTQLWLAEKLRELNEELKTTICKCKRTPTGQVASLHKCVKCGFEGAYYEVHGNCLGCAYRKANRKLKPRRYSNYYGGIEEH